MPNTSNLNIDLATMTPNEALLKLKEGNFRFINNLNRNHDLLMQVLRTKEGQSPFAAIVSCMDSRTSAELILDQGLGDIFSIRLAGNVISPNVLGSLEYATAIVGSKLILVLGHTNCGAIKGACDHVELGNLTNLLREIQPAIDMETSITEDRTSLNKEFVEAVTYNHVIYTTEQIKIRSEVIRNLVDQSKVGIVPAIYDVATGKINFIEEKAIF